MKPTEYESLISQLIDNEVDMDELRSLVAAEKNKREEEKKREKEEFLKTKRRNNIRADLADAIICYIEELVEDPQLHEWLESAEGWDQIIDALVEVEDQFEKTNKLFNNPKLWRDLIKVDDAEIDAVRKWLKSKK